MKHVATLALLLVLSAATAQTTWEYGFFYFFGGDQPSWAWTTEIGTTESDSLETFWEELTGGLWLGVSGVNIAVVSWLGSEGWELVDVEDSPASATYYFKRQR